MASQLETKIQEAIQSEDSQQNFSKMRLPFNHMTPTDEMTMLQGNRELFQEGIGSRVLNIRGDVNVLGLVIGVVLSSSIGGIVTRFLPAMGKYAAIIAGFILVMILKSGMGRDFAYGVLIGGIASLLSGFTSSLSLGGVDFSEGGMMRPEFAEDRTSFGGSDGITVSSPARATFR